MEASAATNDQITRLTAGRLNTALHDSRMPCKTDAPPCQDVMNEQARDAEILDLHRIRTMGPRGRNSGGRFGYRSEASPGQRAQEDMLFTELIATRMILLNLLKPLAMGQPVTPEDFEAMRLYFCQEWGNPFSAYKFGSEFKGVIETARAQVPKPAC